MRQAMIIEKEILDTVFLKSKKSFDELFKDAQEIIGVTYCDSPELILEFFENNHLEKMELLVGNVKDYRERLRGKADIADKLEQLKKEDKLVIYTSDKEIHSKIYFVKRDGSWRFINTSANLTKTAERGITQKNYAHIFHITNGGEKWNTFYRDYEKHMKYGKAFLEDLTKELEGEPEENREKIIERWLEVEGEATSREIQKIKKEMVDKATDLNTEPEFVIDLSGKDKIVKKGIRGYLKELNATFSNEEGEKLKINRNDYIQKYKRYGIPMMRVDNEKRVICALSEPKIMTEKPQSPEEVYRALEHIEALMKTVDKYGQTNNPTYVKAHMFEAIIYMLWAPLCNHWMRIYERNNATPEKPLPFLYIYGEASSGKGTFSGFLMRLLSENEIQKSLPAEGIGKTEIGYLKQQGTSFPIVLDDVTSSRLRTLGESSRNYWKEWDDDSRFPILIFISNKTKPQPCGFPILNNSISTRVRMLIFGVNPWATH